MAFLRPPGAWVRLDAHAPTTSTPLRLQAQLLTTMAPCNTAECHQGCWGVLSETSNGVITRNLRHGGFLDARNQVRNLGPWSSTSAAAGLVSALTTRPSAPALKAVDASCGGSEPMGADLCGTTSPKWCRHGHMRLPAGLQAKLIFHLEAACGGMTAPRSTVQWVGGWRLGRLHQCKVTPAC
jgi:hypothetical protein